jgi:hypothetical protein
VSPALDRGRILQEAFANVRRHSAAENVEVELRTDDEANLIEVADDGRGFDAGSARTGIGISAMHERVEGLGGKIEVKSRPGEGTKVTVRIPLEACHISRIRLIYRQNEEPTSGLEPLSCSLRVSGQGLLSVAQDCKSRINKGLSVPCIAQYCRVLRAG